MKYVAALALACVGVAAQASTIEASITNIKWTLVDLDPTDNVEPWLKIAGRGRLDRWFHPPAFSDESVSLSGPVELATGNDFVSFWRAHSIAGGCRMTL